MTPEEVFDMAMKEAEVLVALKPVVEMIMQEPYGAASLIIQQKALLEKYKEKYGEL